MLVVDGDSGQILSGTVVFARRSRGTDDCHWNFDYRVVDPSGGLTAHLLKAVGTDARSLGKRMQMERIPAWLQAIKLDRNRNTICRNTLIKFGEFAFSIQRACLS